MSKNNNPTGKGGFQERPQQINRKGRPLRTPSALEKEIQDILAEIMYDENGQPLKDEVTNKALTRLRARLRVASSSRNPKEFWSMVEHGYGKPKQRLDITSDGGKITSLPANAEERLSEIYEIIKQRAEKDAK